jgi:hypothetical protein
MARTRRPPLDELMIVNPGSPAAPRVVRLPGAKETAMAKVEGLKEKLHYPLYDAFFVPPASANGTPTFSSSMTDPRVIRYFVDVQNKTKLETNMQAAGQLPSLNSFEARAMRVVVSSLQPRKEDSRPEKLRHAFNEPEFMADLIYSSVTTLLVGEKTMIELPTFGFPSGAGVFSGFPSVATHGSPDPMATFRFAEPVMIEPQQNFRVELQFPREVPERVASVTGPLRVWVQLDGYMVRDVQ